MYLNKKWEKLVELNIYFYKYIFQILNKDINIKMASDYDLQGKKVI